MSSSEVDDFFIETEERIFTKEEVDAFLATKKDGFVHEMKILAVQIKKWSDGNQARMKDGMVTINENVSPELKQHIIKTYKKFEDIKNLILTIDKDYFKETDAGFFYCPYIPLQKMAGVWNATDFNNGSLPSIGLKPRYGVTGSTEYGTIGMILPAGTVHHATNSETGEVSILVHDGDGKVFKC